MYPCVCIASRLTSFVPRVVDGTVSSWNYRKFCKRQTSENLTMVDHEEVQVHYC